MLFDYSQNPNKISAIPFTLVNKEIEFGKIWQFPQVHPVCERQTQVHAVNCLFHAPVCVLKLFHPCPRPTARAGLLALETLLHSILVCYGSKNTIQLLLLSIMVSGLKPWDKTIEDTVGHYDKFSYTDIKACLLIKSAMLEEMTY